MPPALANKKIRIILGIAAILLILLISGLSTKEIIFLKGIMIFIKNMEHMSIKKVFSEGRYLGSNM